MAIPTEVAAPLSIAADVYQRQSTGIATFGLSEIIPGILTGIQALKSKPKTGADYLYPLFKYTDIWNRLVQAKDPLSRAQLFGAPAIVRPRGTLAARPARLHPHEQVVQLIQSREGVPRAQAEGLFRETLVYAELIRRAGLGGFPMALNIGGILGQVGTIFGGGQNQIFQGISNVANLASQFFPTASNVPAVAQPTQLAARPMVQAGLGMLPAIRGAGGMVARGFFNKFPNLALAMQQLRDRGMIVKRSQLWSMLKRFGPEVLVTGGILTAAAVSELMIAGPGHRRMNPANARALRRAARRIKSFHRLCGSIDLLKSRGRRRTSTFCGTCRKNPCRC